MSNLLMQKTAGDMFMSTVVPGATGAFVGLGAGNVTGKLGAKMFVRKHPEVKKLTKEDKDLQKKLKKEEKTLDKFNPYLYLHNSDTDTDNLTLGEIENIVENGYRSLHKKASFSGKIKVNTNRMSDSTKKFLRNSALSFGSGALLGGAISHKYSYKNEKENRTNPNIIKNRIEQNKKDISTNDKITSDINGHRLLIKGKPYSFIIDDDAAGDAIREYAGKNLKNIKYKDVEMTQYKLTDLHDEAMDNGEAMDYDDYIKMVGKNKNILRENGSLNISHPKVKNILEQNLGKRANEMSVLLQEKLAYSDANVNRAVQMNPDGTYGMKNNLRTNFNHIKLDVKNNTNTTKIGKGINTIKSDATNIGNAFKTSGSAVGDAFKNGTSNVVGAIKNKTGVGTAIKNSTSSVGSAIKTGTGTVGNAIKGLSKGSKIGLGIAAAGTAAAIIGSKIKKKKEQNKTAETFEEMLEKMAKEQ